MENGERIESIRAGGAKGASGRKTYGTAAMRLDHRELAYLQDEELRSAGRFCRRRFAARRGLVGHRERRQAWAFTGS